MPVPNVSYKVEIAWSSNWRTPAASRVWTDVSAYVELQDGGIKIDYGRSDEVSVADANTMSLTFDNKDGRFTWGNTASPYYPNVKLGRPIRVTATVGGADYVRFVGYINEWPVEWPGESAGFATTTITASSRLSRLGLDSPIVNAVAETVGLVAPDYYWPLTEPAGSTVAAEASGAPSLALRVSRRADKVAFGYDDSAAPFGVTDALPALNLTANTTSARSADGRLDVDLPEVVMGPGVPGAVTIGFFRKNLQPGGDPDNGQDSVLAFRDSTVDESVATELIFDYIRYALVRHYVDGVPNAFSVSWPELKSWAPMHHIAATLVCDGVNLTLTAYFDGVAVGSDTGAAVNLRFTRLRLSSTGYNTLVGRVALWRSAASAASIKEIADAGLDGYRGDTTDDRLSRLATWAQIPAAEITVAASPITLAGIVGGDKQVEALMRDVETAEAGVLYDDRLGTLVLRPRSERYNVAPALTIALTSDRVSGFTPRVDRSNLANVGKGKNADGTVEATYTDEASRDDYGDAAYDVETSAIDPDEPLQLITWAVNGNSQPRPRAPSVSLSVIDWIGSADLAALLGLDIGSLLRLTAAPTQAPGATSSDYFVEGYTEEIGVGSWSIAPNLSPSRPHDSVLILDSATRGLLDTNVIAL